MASAAPGDGSGTGRRGRRPPRRCAAACRRSAGPRASRGRARTAARHARRRAQGCRRASANRRGSTTSATPWWPSNPASAVSDPPSTSTIGIRRLVACRTSFSSACASLRHDQQPVRLATGDERLLDRSATGDELLVGAEDVGRRQARARRMTVGRAAYGGPARGGRSPKPGRSVAGPGAVLAATVAGPAGRPRSRRGPGPPAAGSTRRTGEGRVAGRGRVTRPTAGRRAGSPGGRSRSAAAVGRRVAAGAARGGPVGRRPAWSARSHDQPADGPSVVADPPDAVRRAGGGRLADASGRSTTVAGRGRSGGRPGGPAPRRGGRPSTLARRSRRGPPARPAARAGPGGRGPDRARRRACGRSSSRRGRSATPAPPRARRQRWPSRVSSTAMPRAASSSRSRSDPAQSRAARAASAGLEERGALGVEAIVHVRQHAEHAIQVAQGRRPRSRHPPSTATAPRSAG